MSFEGETRVMSKLNGQKLVVRKHKMSSHDNELLYQVGQRIRHKNQEYEVVATIQEHMELQEKHKAWKYRLVKHLGGGHMQVYIFRDNAAIKAWLAGEVQLNEHEFIIAAKSQ